MLRTRIGTTKGEQFVSARTDFFKGKDDVGLERQFATAPLLGGLSLVLAGASLRCRLHGRLGSCIHTHTPPRHPCLPACSAPTPPAGAAEGGDHQQQLQQQLLRRVEILAEAHAAYDTLFDLADATGNRCGKWVGRTRARAR